jgi:hypothetical protein
MGMIGGAESAANAVTTDEAVGSVVMALDDGGWVVTWTYTAANSSTILGTRSQMFNADGTTDGSQIQVATDAISGLEAGSMDDGGWFVVYGHRQTGTQHDRLWLQKYHADGSLNGSADFVSTFAGDQHDPSIGMLKDGGWVVTWTDKSRLGSLESGYRDEVYEQRYDALGAKVGNEIQVSGGDWDLDEGIQPAITGLADGGWVTTWNTLGYIDSKLRRINEAQIYNADGTARGGNFQIDHDNMLDNQQYVASVTSLASGGFVVAYTLEPVVPPSGDAQYFKIFNADGTELTTALPLHDSIAGQVISASIAGLDDGHFVAAWQTQLDDGNGWGIYSQLFNADGSRNGDVVLVNTTTSGDEVSPSITVLKDDRWVVSWTEVKSGADVVNQKVFHYAHGAPEGADKAISVFEDGSHTFTAGDFGFSDDDPDTFTGVVITTLPGQGSLTLNGAAVAAGAFVAAADISKLVWTPPLHVDGDALATMTFQVKDNGDLANGGVNLDQSANTITLNVANVNLAPTGTDQRVTVLEDSGRFFKLEDFGFSDNPNDTPANHFAGIVITGAQGHAGLGGDGTFKIDYNTLISADNIPKLYFAPEPNYAGAAEAKIMFKVVDDGGTANGGHDTSDETYTFTFDVTGINDAPGGTDKTVTINEDKPYAFSVGDFGFVDSTMDGDHLADVTIVTLPTSGKLTLNRVAVHAGDVVARADLHNLVWTPAANAHGNDLAEFTFTVRDDGGKANDGHDTSAPPNTFTFNVTEVTDVYTGTKKNDTFKGTADHDVFNGKAGNDTLAGNGASDTFMFGTGYDRDTITDFGATGKDHDVIDLSGLKSVHGFKDVKHDMTQHHHDAWIDGGDGDVLVLKHVDIHDLGKADFTF